MTDPILLWNEVALEANRVSHTNGMGEQTGPTLSSRALGIVHLAMYDAYAGIIDDPVNLPRYIATPPSPSLGASVDINEAAEVAVAAAAHKTLSTLFPSQTSAFDIILAAAGDPSQPPNPNNPHDFGVAVGQAILDDRENDPDAGASGYMPSSARGKHRPDPDNPTQGFHAPFYGAQSKGFAFADPTRHQLDAPPFGNGTNAAYLKALREVRGKGIMHELMGTLPTNVPAIKPRTGDETVIGIYWGYDGAAKLGTPPRLYNKIVRRIAMTRSPGHPTTPNSVAQNARLFAFVNAAMADAGILSWEQKYIHDFWRPVVGIREHDSSMGPAATHAVADNDLTEDCDASWLPLGAPNTNSNAKNFTPPFPAYPSGHATFGAAAFHITRLFYGVSVGDRHADNFFDDLSFVSEEFNGVNRDNKGTVRPRHVRNFEDGLWQMIEENGRSRVDLGVHWVFDAFAVKSNGKPDLTKNIGGVPLGLDIAEDIFQAGGGKAPKKSTVEPLSQSASAKKVAAEGRTASFSSSYTPSGS